jgi:hypothetical protein
MFLPVVYSVPDDIINWFEFMADTHQDTFLILYTK